mmetsp:Transcript_11503/g.15003  ORF Transcript_11503/g.15003 Transcript_11503/m.15003 type:complete len:316 (-) Transcript_11503:421-1368(-)
MGASATKDDVHAAEHLEEEEDGNPTQVINHCHRFLTAHIPECDILMEGHCSNEEVFALIILNTNCCGPSFQRLWDISTFHLCADGGANRLHDSLPPPLRNKYVPSVIKGDLDSLRDDVKDFYRDLGTKIIRDGDQNCNDFYKCLNELNRLREVNCPDKKMTVLALGAFGGRFDQEMASINACFEWQTFERIMLVSEDNLGFLLVPGVHKIVPNHFLEGPTCGLLPIGGPISSVTTKGLKWNLSNDSLKFGGLVSSSNQIVDSVVEITNSDPLLWMTQLKTEGWESLPGQKQPIPILPKSKKAQARLINPPPERGD